MEQAFHTTHIDNDDDQILIASWNPTRNAPYHCYRLVVPEYVKTRKTDLINNEIRDSCNKSAPFITPSCLPAAHSRRQRHLAASKAHRLKHALHTSVKWIGFNL